LARKTCRCGSDEVGGTLKAVVDLFEVVQKYPPAIIATKPNPNMTDHILYDAPPRFCRILVATFNRRV